MKTGHTPSRSVPEYWDDTTIPWFTLADVWQLRDGRQIYLGETANRISDLGLANSAAELLPSGTVVLSRTASVGFSGVMPRPMATSQDFWNWVCGPDLMPEYLNYQFKAIAPQLRALNMGSTHQTIYQKDAAGIEVLVPPLSEQRAIVGYLDRETGRIDRLIAEQQRLIELTAERRAAVIALATGWGRDLGEGWSWMRLSWLFGATGSGTTPAPEDTIESTSETVPWVTTGELRERRIEQTARGVLPHVIEKYSALGVYPAGSLLVAMYGATIGRMAILAVPAACNQACCALVEPLHATAEFVQYSLLAARPLLLLDAAGGGQPNINQEKLRSFRIPVPSVDEQRRITAYLDEQTATVDSLAQEAQRLIDLARERRSALITAVVTGQLDVRSVA
jgi:type I restriction enzyme S subunit